MTDSNNNNHNNKMKINEFLLQTIRKPKMNKTKGNSMNYSSEITLQYLLFQVDLALFDQTDLLVYHIVDALTHSSMPLLSPLCFFMPLMSLLRAQGLTFASFSNQLFVLEIFFLVVFQVFLDIGRDLREVEQLLPYLRIDLVKVVHFHTNLVDLDLGSKSGAGVPTFN